MTPISRGFGGRRRDDVHPWRIPPGQYYERGLPVLSAGPTPRTAGPRRSPATMPGFHAGRSPRNRGLRYPADPPKVEEIVAVMCVAGNGRHGQRLRGLIVILW